MNKLIKFSYILLLCIATISCGIISNDKFIFIGHGATTPDYQLYYDKTKSLFILINKRDGCFQKDDTGTCLAFTHEQAEVFRKNVLHKMIEIKSEIEKKSLTEKQIEEIKKSGLATSSIKLNIGDVYATPVRQILINRKQEYSLIRDSYKLRARIGAIVVPDGKETYIKIAYSVSFPEIRERYGFELRPFIIDPDYFYTHMTEDAIKKALTTQRTVLKENKSVNNTLNKYLKKVASQDS
ncbi:FTN_0109 family protein [Francisella sciaenopsi]|uniref:Lipoprotein n=1 Tax=Francisella sciaenopsi TaxID=3055034 RepID=A0ABQ6PE83_9GAMM